MDSRYARARKHQIAPNCASDAHAPTVTQRCGTDLLPRQPGAESTPTRPQPVHRRSGSPALTGSTLGPFDDDERHDGAVIRRDGEPDRRVVGRVYSDDPETQFTLHVVERVDV